MKIQELKDYCAQQAGYESAETAPDQLQALLQLVGPMLQLVYRKGRHEMAQTMQQLAAGAVSRSGKKVELLESVAPLMHANRQIRPQAVPLPADFLPLITKAPANAEL